jgi:hypothetical protein
MDVDTTASTAAAAAAAAAAYTGGADAAAAAASDNEANDGEVEGAFAADTPANQLVYNDVLLTTNTVVGLRVSLRCIYHTTDSVIELIGIALSTSCLHALHWSMELHVIAGACCEHCCHVDDCVVCTQLIVTNVCLATACCAMQHCVHYNRIS